MGNKEGAKDYVGIRKSLNGQSLGELEAQILDIIWDMESPVTSTQVFKAMYSKRELSYSTIMLTMSKLARKGILAQTRKGEKKTDPFIYTVNVSRQEMGIALLNSVSEQVMGKPLHEAIAEFGGEAKSSNQLVGEIQKLVGNISAE